MRVDDGLTRVADFKAVPESMYELVITGPIEVKQLEDKARDIGGIAYSFSFPTSIASGQYQGKEIRNQKVNTSKGSRYFLAAMLKGLGVKVGEDGSFDTEEVYAGLRFKAYIGIRKVKDEEKSTPQNPVYREFNEIEAETIQKVA